MLDWDDSTIKRFRGGMQPSFGHRGDGGAGLSMMLFAQVCPVHRRVPGAGTRVI
jgi:hypothetical protein